MIMRYIPTILFSCRFDYLIFTIIIVLFLLIFDSIVPELVYMMLRDEYLHVLDFLAFDRVEKIFLME